MDPEKKNDTTVDDEAELDALINADISKVKAGEELKDEPSAPAPTKPEEKSEGKPAEPASPETPKVEDPSKPPVVENKEDEGYEFRIPNKGKFESDETYEARIELLDLVKKRRLADTPEKKQQLSDEIKAKKGQLRNLGAADKINNPLNPKVEDPKPGDPKVDPNLEADREVAKRLGLVSKEDVQEILDKTTAAAETRGTLQQFVDRHKQREFKDPDVLEVFWDFVDANYNWRDKTGKELMTVLELARENMFKPSETIQERVLKGADVQEKIGAMSFPGGTGPRSTFSPEKQKSIDEMKATGMSEEKAIELLED